MAHGVQLRVAVDTDRVDDQGVAFPVAHGISKPCGIVHGIGRMRTPIDRDYGEPRVLLEKEPQKIVVLKQFHRMPGHDGARKTVRQAGARIVVRRNVVVPLALSPFSERKVRRLTHLTDAVRVRERLSDVPDGGSIPDSGQIGFAIGKARRGSIQIVIPTCQETTVRWLLRQGGQAAHKTTSSRTADNTLKRTTISESPLPASVRGPVQSSRTRPDRRRRGPPSWLNEAYSKRPRCARWPVSGCRSTGARTRRPTLQPRGRTGSTFLPEGPSIFFDELYRFGHKFP